MNDQSVEMLLMLLKRIANANELSAQTLKNHTDTLASGEERRRHFEERIESELLKLREENARLKQLNAVMRDQLIAQNNLISQITDKPTAETEED